VNHRNVIYQGEHTAIIEPPLWDQVNSDFGKATRPQPERSHEPQEAPLAGLLICAGCEQPMIATYSNKGTRRYRYYVCNTARQKGWKACATKSVSANLMESSIALQLRSRLVGMRETFQVSDSQWTGILEQDPKVIRTLVEQVRYNGPNGAVWVKLRDAGDSSVEHRTLTFEYKIPRRRGRSLPAFPAASPQ
jgi:hypothetical protein